MTTTVVIQIGNTDDKLTQSEWSQYVEDMSRVIEMWATTIHFFGGSSTWEPWQNVAWVIECSQRNQLELQNELIPIIRHRFGQDSVAWTKGSTEFI